MCNAEEEEKLHEEHPIYKIMDLNQSQDLNIHFTLQQKSLSKYLDAVGIFDVWVWC